MNIPTTALELSKLLNTDAYNLRNQLVAANGQVNYNRETDQLTPDQLRVWLPRYLQGKGQFKGEKRAMVEAMIEQLNANQTPKEQPKTVQPKTQKPQQGYQQKTQPTGQPKTQVVENQLQINEVIGKSFFARPWFAMAALLGCLAVQVRHFALCYALIAGDKASIPNLIFGALLGIFSESFGIVQAVNGGSRWWIFIVSLVSFVVNSLASEVWLKAGYLYGGAMLMNAIVPACILGFSLLYIEKNNK